MLTPILTHMAAPRWHTIPEISAETGLLPIRIRNCLDALAVARMVEWRGDVVALKGGWIVADRIGRTIPFAIDTAIGLAREIGGSVERDVT